MNVFAVVNLLGMALFGVVVDSFAQENFPDVTDTTGMKVSYDNQLTLATTDGFAAISLGGRVQTETRFFSYPGDSPFSRDVETELFDIRRARLEMSATIAEYFTAELSAEFSGDPELKNAYLKLDFFPNAEIRVGQFTYPYGNESIDSSKYEEFIGGSAISSALSHGRDRGINVRGAPWDGFLFYQVGLMSGAGSNTVDNNDLVDYLGRFVVNPTYWLDDFFQLWLELSLNSGTQTSVGDSLTVETESRSGATYFEAEIPVGDEYDRFRWSVETTMLIGPAMLKAEYLSGRYGIEQSATISGGYVAASVFLTGEQRSVKHGLVHRQTVDAPLDLEWGHYGAWELALRYSWFDVDDLFFQPDGLYDGWQAVSREEYFDNGSAWTLGVNWYPAEQVRVMMNTIFSFAPESADSENDRSELVEVATVVRFGVVF